MEIEFYCSLMNILNSKHFLLVFPTMKNRDIKHGIQCGSWIGLCCGWCAGNTHLPGAGNVGHCGISAEFLWWKPWLYPIWGGLERQPLFNDWIMRSYRGSSSGQLCRTTPWTGQNLRCDGITVQLLLSCVLSLTGIDSRNAPPKISESHSVFQVTKFKKLINSRNIESK